MGVVGLFSTQSNGPIWDIGIYRPGTKSSCDRFTKFQCQE